MWNKPGIAYLAVAIGVLGHASSEFVAVLSGVSGPEVSSWRFLLGGTGLLLIVMAVTGPAVIFSILRAEWKLLVPISLAGVSLAYLLFHWALDFASVIQVATLVTTIPIFVGISNLIINGQPVSAVKWLTGCAAVLAVALLISDGYLGKVVGSGSSLVGVFMALGCAALASAFSVLIRPVIVRHGAAPVTAIAMFIGGIGLWVVVGAAFGIWVNPLKLADMPAREVWALLVIAFWNTTITQYLWIGGLAHAPDITRASYLFFLKPAIAAMLAVAFLSQTLTTIQTIAIIVICGSVLIEFMYQARQKRLAATPSERTAKPAHS
ncbi:MAG: DMT family transporter [Burkholderiales bacterium]|nr:DMT family transporter [Burkholderiales bacterium]